MTTMRSVNKNIKSPISQRANSIAPSGIRKFFDLLASMDGVISLGVGEPDYSTPWGIREAAIYSLEQGRTMYTSNLGTPELRQELARHAFGIASIVFAAGKTHRAEDGQLAPAGVDVVGGQHRDGVHGGVSGRSAARKFPAPSMRAGKPASNFCSARTRR